MGTGMQHRSTTTATRSRPAAAAAWTACVLVATALLGACSAQATTNAVPATGRAPVSASTSARSGDAGGGRDWAHVLQVVADLKARPPTEPLLCLLGGSAARESTIDDASWAAQVRRLGGPSVAAYNLGSRNRTLAQDVALVRALPKAPGIVYIGIGVDRFTWPPSHPALDLPQPTQSLPPYKQHQYSQSEIRSDATKRALLDAWLAKRYPAFKKNYASNLKTLEQLLVTCKERGLRPVLLELPRNTAIAGQALDAAVARYTSGCRALAKKHAVLWVSFIATARLPSADFYDLWHLVEPGRTVWQRLLSAKTVTLLDQYGLGSPVPTETPAS